MFVPLAQSGSYSSSSCIRYQDYEKLELFFLQQGRHTLWCICLLCCWPTKQKRKREPLILFLFYSTVVCFCFIFTTTHNIMSIITIIIIIKHFVTYTKCVYAHTNTNTHNSAKEGGKKKKRVSCIFSLSFSLFQFCCVDVLLCWRKDDRESFALLCFSSFSFWALLEFQYGLSDFGDGFNCTLEIKGFGQNNLENFLHIDGGMRWTE